MLMKFIYLTLSLSLSYIHELYTPLITWFLVGLVSLGHQIILQAKISICTNIYSFVILQRDNYWSIDSRKINSTNKKSLSTLKKKAISGENVRLSGGGLRPSLP
ncbi:unnamed protein product [Brassica rapa]|uniref:Uncharacterized protein n=1 Tax=Brassica campestris TaxID=3711 RepID=A0A8D9M7T3_BRACM|nr:unnamed protein product [Brassica rapa]